MFNRQYSSRFINHSAKHHVARIPLPLAAVVWGILVSYLPGILPTGIAGGVSFLGWAIPLVACAWYVSQYATVRFPLTIWAPWILWVLGYLFFSTADNALQRSIMMLTPLVVGAAFSTLRPDAAFLATCERYMNRFLVIFFAAAAVATGLSQGALVAVSGFAAGSITASILAAWYAAHFVITRNNKSLLAWLLLAAVPVLANTRTGMLAVALTLPLVFAPWPLARRAIAIGLMAVAGLAVFQSERIQNKMFFSGKGTLDDAIVGIEDMISGKQARNSDFATSGRISMSQYLVPKLEEDYWFGHGANTTEAISVAIAGVTHPHNDWLRLRYEYGHLGMLIFALTMAAQAYNAWRLAHRLNRQLAIYLYAGSTAFLPMTIFMFSDNVIMYSAWFGNLQFAFLGLGYAALNQPQKWMRSTRRKTT